MFWMTDSPHVGRQSLRHRPQAQQGTPRSKTWHTEGNTQRQQLNRVTSDRQEFTAPSLTSLSIHGLPRHVAKQPNRPKITMQAPVPMRTYGALVLSSDAREK